MKSLFRLANQSHQRATRLGPLLTKSTKPKPGALSHKALLHTTPEINVFERTRESNLYKHLSPFIVTNNGFFPRRKLSAGDLVPVQCPRFDELTEDLTRLSRIEKNSASNDPIKRVINEYTKKGYAVVRSDERQAISKKVDLHRTKLVGEIDSLFANNPTSVVPEEFGRPRLESLQFNISLQEKDSKEFFETKLARAPELQKVVSTWIGFIEAKAKYDKKDLSTITISVRKNSYENQKEAQNMGIKSWLIPHNDRDVKPYDYSIFAPIQVAGLKTLNNVIAADGQVLETAGPTDMVLLDNRHVFHDAIYLFDSEATRGVRHFLNISAY